MAGKRGSLEVLLALGLTNNKMGQHKEAVIAVVGC